MPKYIIISIRLHFKGNIFFSMWLKQKQNYICSNMAQKVLLVPVYNESYLNNNNYNMLYGRTMQITTYLLHFVSHTCIQCQMSRPNLIGSREF